MFVDGFVEEVKMLLDKGYSADLPSLSAIGYREIINYLHGEITLEDARAQIKRKTRVFVRRQSNWFKLTDPDIHWFKVDPHTKQEIQAFIRELITTETDGI
jgi:tRNA dimethylallyltransferase